MTVLPGYVVGNGHSRDCVTVLFGSGYAGEWQYVNASDPIVLFHLAGLIKG